MKRRVWIPTLLILAVALLAWRLIDRERGGAGTGERPWPAAEPGAGTGTDATLRGATSSSQAPPAEAAGSGAREEPATGGWISGRLVAAGDDLPVPRFRVRAFVRASATPERNTPTTWTLEAARPEAEACAADVAVDDQDGSFRLGPLPPAVYALSIAVPGHPPLVAAGGAKSYEPTRGIVVQAGETTDLGVVVLPRTGPHRFVVLDAATEDPVVGARFAGGVKIGGRLVETPLEPIEVLGNGNYLLPVFLRKPGVGFSVVIVRKEGYAPASPYFSGRPPGKRMVVRLRREVSVGGVVRTETGAPFGDARVVVRRAADRLVVATGRTGSDGRFAPLGLVPGLSYELLVFPPAGDRLLTIVPLTASSRMAGDLELGGPDATALAGSIRIRGEPVDRALVSLDGPDDRRTQFWTGPDGRFRFDGLTPGPHQLAVNAEEHDLFLSRTAAVEEGAVTPVDIDLGRAIRGGVRVTDLAGEPVAFAELKLQARLVGGAAEADEWRSNARVSKDGTFEILVDAPGVYILGPAFSDHVVLEEVTVDLTTEPVLAGVVVPVVRDPQDGTIRVRVRDAATGEPVLDAGHRYRWKQTRGAGAVHPDGALHQDGAGLGTHRLTVTSPRHAPLLVEIELTPTVRHVERTVDVLLADCVRIETVFAASRADEADIEVGDLVVRYGGSRIRNQEDLWTATRAHDPSDTVDVEVIRNGSSLTLALPGGRLDIGLANHRAGLE